MRLSSRNPGADMHKSGKWVAALGLLAVAAGLIALCGSSLGLGSVVTAAEKHGFDRSDLDTTCKPCQDFARFATGGWTARNPIQPSYPYWDRFGALQDQNQSMLRGILEEA